MLKCCKNCLELGCIDCGIVDIGVVASVAGTYKVYINWGNDSTYTFVLNFALNDAIVIPAGKINEYGISKISILNPAGDLVVKIVNGIEYDCFSVRSLPAFPL